MKTEWAVNYCAASPVDPNTVCIVGDSKNVLLADLRFEKIITNLSGHQDFSFSCSWHAEGYLLATGNQDMTARIWDIRKPSDSLHVLPSTMASIRSVKFSPNGDFFVMSEAADFVHVYDSCTKSFDQVQTIDFFGETSGVGVSPDSNRLFIGIADNVYGTILEFTASNRSRWTTSQTFL
eukprot:TRINITY_DN45441_c0_g2_i1.p1 TRINITY_DN45441_c0_g2~~TRINITY_DN45441_c0_g2_i1.p1  ORF type:complete len:179 (+),score=30.37 TRINITY_DN45441_c0_g2_i1:264-800(+)